MMKTRRNQKKRSSTISDEAAPETPSPKRPSVLGAADDESPKSVVADSTALASTGEEVSVAAAFNSGVKDSTEGVEETSDDNSITAAVVEDLPCRDLALKKEYDDMAASSSTAKHSLMMIMRKIPRKVNIFHPPPPPHVFFTIYSHFAFFHASAMKVLFAAFLWYEHESNNDTEANWPMKEIFVCTANTHDEMMSHEYLIDRPITFLSAAQIGRPLVDFPAIKKRAAIDTSSTVVAVPRASVRDVTQGKVDGSVASLRSDLMAESSTLSPPSKNSW
jgi:hypothetical protein